MTAIFLFSCTYLSCLYVITEALHLKKMCFEKNQVTMTYIFQFVDIFNLLLGLLNSHLSFQVHFANKASLLLIRLHMSLCLLPFQFMYVSQRFYLTNAK